MRRSTCLGLAILAALSVIAVAYTAYWFIVAGQIEDGVVGWAQSARADKIDVSWQKIRVAGFPVAFRVELETAALRDNAVTPSPEFRVPVLSGTAHPWDFADWQVAARQGFTANIAGAGQEMPAKLTAEAADGVVSIMPDGGWNLWLRMQDAKLKTAARVRVASADTWIVVPPKQPRGHSDPKMALAVNARQIELPVAIGPLGDTIDELDFGATLKGPLPNGKLAEAVAAWRDSGGTIELDNLHLKWGALGATATGTIALDQELQPIGGFSGAIQGYDQILTALVQNGQMRAGDAGLARIALTMLAKAGPDGRPEIKTAFRLQNGQMFLGPAKLGKMPRIPWE
jgi:hypothetical protein